MEDYENDTDIKVGYGCESCYGAGVPETKFYLCIKNINI